MNLIYAICIILLNTSLFSQSIKLHLKNTSGLSLSNLHISLADTAFFSSENPIVLSNRFLGQRAKISHISIDTSFVELTSSQISIILSERVYTSIAIAEQKRMMRHNFIPMKSISENSSQFSDALKTNLNLFYSNYGSAGAVEEFKFRGLPSIHSQVMIEGVPLNNEQLGGFNLANISTLNSAAISVYTDGNNANQSSGQFGAAINSITRSRFVHKLSSNYSAGSFNRQRRQIEAESYFGNLAIYAGFLEHRSDNYYEYKRSNNKTAFRNGADYIFSDIHLQGTLLSEKSITKFIYKRSKNDVGVPGPKKNSNAAFQRGLVRQEDQSDLFIIKRQSELNKKQKFTLTAAFNPQELSFYKTSDSKNTYSYLKAEYSAPLFGLLDLDARLEDRYIEFSSRQGSIKYSKVRNYLKAMSRFSWSLNSQEFSAALRFGLVRNYNFPALYDISYAYKLSEALRFAANYSTHYRIPTFNELYYPNANNPKLKAEDGFKRSISILFNEQNIEAKLSFFDAKLWNYVLWLPVDGNLMPINKKKVSQNGFEASANYRFFSFELFAQYLKNALIDEHDRQLVSVAEQQFLIGLEYNNQHFTAAVLHKWTDEFELFDVVKPFPRFNDLSAQAELRQSFHFGKYNFLTAIYANGYNLLNRLSPAHAPYPRPNKHFDIGIKLNISLGD